MNFVIQLIIQILIAIVVAELTAKKPKTNLKAKGLDAFNFPTVSADRAIPYVCGNVLISAPNVIWYGDLVVTTLTKRVKSGLFSSSQLPVGFEYRLGLELSLAWGDIDKLTEIYFGEELAFSGNVFASTAGTPFLVSSPELFGGKENGGGVYASCIFYPGHQTQPADEYMTAHVQDGYRHQGLAKLIWKGPSGNFTGKSGLLGESENISAIKVRVTRLPNYLGSAFEDIDGTANPAEVIYEILTGKHINLPGVPTAPYLIDVDFDLPNLLVAAETFHTEGMGISFQWQQDSIIDDIISDIEEHTQSKLIEDPITGLLQLVLLRNDYDINLVPAYDEASIIGFNNFSTNAEDTLTNEVIATYTQIGSKDVNQPIAIQNSGNLYAQENISTMSLDLTMFTNPETAQKRAFLELQIVSNPLRSGQVILDRSAWGTKVGSIIKLNYAEYKIVNLAARVTGIEYGSLLKRHIVVTFVEDVFSLGDNIFPNPASSVWVDPNTPPSAILDSGIFEVPKRLLDSAEPNQIAMVPVRPTGSEYSYDVYRSLDNGTSYDSLLVGLAFPDAGQLTADIPLDTDYLLANGATFTKSENFTHANNANVPDESFQNFIMINTEIFVYDYLIDNLDETFTTNELHRALLDTLPVLHSIGDLVVPLDQMLYLDTAFANDQNVDFKLLTSSWAGKLDLDDATGIDYTIINRESLPYPPADFQINATQTVPAIFSGDTTITWKGRDRTSMGLFKQGDAENAVESGDITVVEIRQANDIIMHTEDPATSPFIYTLEDELIHFGFYQSQIKIVAFTKNSQGDSLFKWERTINKEAPNTPPSSGFSFVANDREITFTDLSIDADGTVDSWLWDFGDSNTSTDQNPVHTYAVNGTYEVTLIVTDDDSDTGQIIKSVEATDVNKLPISDFSFVILGTVVTFSDLSTDSDGTIASWLWDFGDSNTSTDQNPVYDYGSNAVYLVTLTTTDNEGGVSQIKTKSIGVGVSTIPVLNLPGNDTTLNKLDLITSKIFVPARVSVRPTLGGSGWGGAIAGSIGVGEAINNIQAGSLDLNAYKFSESNLERGNSYETIQIPTNDDIKQIINANGLQSWTFEIWASKSPFSFEIIDMASDDFALSISQLGNQLRVYAGGTGGSQSYRDVIVNSISSLVVVYDANVPSLTYYFNGVAIVGVIESNNDILIVPAPLGVNEYKIRVSSSSFGVNVANIKLAIGAKTAAEVLSDFNSDTANLEGEQTTNVKMLTNLALTDSHADDSEGAYAGFVIEPSLFSGNNAAFKALLGNTNPLDETEVMITNLDANIVKVIQVSGDALQGSQLNVDHDINAGDPPIFFLAKESLSGAGTLTATVQIVVNINGVDYTADNIVLTCTHDAAIVPPVLGATTDLDEAIADASATMHFSLDEVSGTLYADVPATNFLVATTDVAASNKDPLRFDGLGRSASVLNNASSINSAQTLVNTRANFSVEFGLSIDSTIQPGTVQYVCEVGEKYVVNNETARGTVSVYLVTDRIFLRIYYLDANIPFQKTVFAYKSYADNIERWYSVRINDDEISLFVNNELVLTVFKPAGTDLGAAVNGDITLLNAVYQAQMDEFVFYDHAIHRDIIDRNSQYFLTGSYTP